MNSSLRTLFSLSLAAMAFFCTRCSLDNLAGGSGAGNPGGSVTVALRAEITIGMSKSASDSPNAIEFGSKVDSPVVIYDKAGLPFSMSEIFFTCNDFRFMLDQSEDPESVLRSLKNPSPKITYDQQSLILQGGPYSCNGISGQVQPEMGSIRLPVAKYTGIMLNFKKDWNSNCARGQFYLAGTFPYYGKTRRFIVMIERSFYPVFRFAGGIFTLSAGDTTHIELRFDAKRWFEKIDIKEGIEKGALQFNQYGDLVIGRYSDSDPYWDYESAILSGFVSSGKLVLY